VGRLARLLGYLRPYRIAFLLGSLAAVAASFFDGFTFTLLIPFLRLLFGAGTAIAEAPTAVESFMQALAGPLLSSGDPKVTLAAVMVLIVTAMLLKNSALYAASYVAVSIQERVARDLRIELYAHIQRLGLGFTQRAKGGQLVATLLSDADQARQGVSTALGSAVRNAALVLIYLSILFALSWRLTLITLLLAPALVLTLRPILLRIRSRIGAAVEARGEMAAIASETVSGSRLVKAYGAESHERGRFGSAAEAHVHHRLRAERLAILASPLSEILGAVVIAVLLLVGVPATATTMRPELFVTFIAVTLRLLSPVKGIGQFPTLLTVALASAERIFRVLDLSPDDVDAPGEQIFPGLEHEIEFHDVWYGYEPNRWALRGVSVSVRKGEVVAVVGPSGAGKSTLVDLLPRFLDPQRGAVLVDGVELVRYSRSSVRCALGIVSQETMIFNDTVRANIAYGIPGAEEPAVVAVARAANAHEFICHLPLAYDTILGERGTLLSGGERQRIAIARVLLRDPPVLILDEATSALDPESERLVQEAISRLMESRTVFVIAHRFSTVMRADRILVLDGGRIVEAGRHRELVAAGGLYQRLHEMELAGRMD
jgi:subfamily B ATP-binding cassette protein MsbA